MKKKTSHKKKSFHWGHERISNCNSNSQCSQNRLSLCKHLLFLQYLFFTTLDKHIETSGTHGQSMKPSGVYTV